MATRTLALFETGGRVPHDRTLKALVACLEEMGVEFLMDDNAAADGIGIRVRHPKLHPDILSARAQRSEKGGLAETPKRTSEKED